MQSFRNNISPSRGMQSLVRSLPPPATREVVFVVRTPAKHLVGVHRLADKERSQSYIFGFQERNFAELIASSLEGYYEQHGTFADVDLLRLQPAHARQLSAMGIEEVLLADLVERLKGTGVMVALLSRDMEQAPDNLVFRCHDVNTDTTTQSVVQFLNRTWNASQQPQPKPCGPPTIPASLVVRLLAASLLISLALLDTVGIFWMLHLR